MRPYTSAFVALFAAVVVAAPAFAQEGDVLPSARVSRAGVDLASPEGAKMALARIEYAADDVCGGRPDSRALDRAPAFAKCRAAAVAGAVKSLDRPLLSRLAAGAPSPLVVAAR